MDYDESENTLKVNRFATNLRIALTTNDANVVNLAARTFGKLARIGGALVSVTVHFHYHSLILPKH